MKNNQISRLIRKWTALLLSLCLCFTCTAAFAEAESDLPEETEAPEAVEAFDEEAESGDDALPEEAATEAPLVTESDKEIRLHHICYVLCGILGILLIGWIVTVVVMKKQITPPVAEVHSEGESDE